MDLIRIQKKNAMDYIGVCKYLLYVCIKELLRICFGYIMDLPKIHFGRPMAFTFFNMDLLWAWHGFIKDVL